MNGGIDMNNPNPLDLELKIKEISNLLEMLAFSNLTYEERKELKETIETDIKSLLNKIKQRIKEACEFYLKYKNNPSLLWKENTKYRKKLKKFGITKKWVSEDCDELYDWEDYNEWLFKLAFGDVLE